MYDHSNSFQGHQDSVNQTTNMKWVINLSSTLLTSTQEVLLVHGPDFVVAPPNPPYLEYITAIKLACQSLNANEAEECRADIHRALRNSHPYKPNLRREEWKALKQLKTDKRVDGTNSRQGGGIGGDRQARINTKKPGPF